jgi:hypothetical protein
MSEGPFGNTRQIGGSCSPMRWVTAHDLQSARPAVVSLFALGAHQC